MNPGAKTISGTCSIWKNWFGGAEKFLGPWKWGWTKLEIRILPILSDFDHFETSAERLSGQGVLHPSRGLKTLIMVFNPPYHQRNVSVGFFCTPPGNLIFPVFLTKICQNPIF
jgi:hypothetical protein